jgi:hypothetical protein
LIADGKVKNTFSIGDWYQITQLDSDFFKVTEPGQVTFYVYREGDRGLFIDSGLGLDKTLAHELIKCLDITKFDVLCTHAHCDHIGLNALAESIYMHSSEWAKYINTSLTIDEQTVLDVSPYAAGGEIMQGVGLVKENRFINLYHYYASLIHGMWGYQAGVFYGKEPLYKSANLLADLTDWYGIKYAILTPGFDPFDKYTATGWKKVVPGVTQNSDEPFIHAKSVELWENSQANGLFTATKRPVVLAIGDYKKAFLIMSSVQLT